MTTYVILLYQDESKADAVNADDRAALHTAHQAFQRAHASAVVGGDALQRSGTARTWRRSGDTLVSTDAPFAETKEVLAGFYLIQAADLDEALAIAKDVPTPHGGLEVRPTMVYD